MILLMYQEHSEILFLILSCHYHFGQTQCNTKKPVICNLLFYSSSSGIIMNGFYKYPYKSQYIPHRKVYDT